MSQTNDKVDATALVPEKPVQQLAAILAAGEAFIAAHPSEVIPQGLSPFLNNQALLGRPFLIVSQWMFKTIQTEYGPWEQVQVYICEVDLDKNTIFDAALATLHGNVLVNQFRAQTVGSLIGQGVFTIGMKKFKEGRNPAYVLKYYERGIDKPPFEEGGGPSAFDGSGWDHARIPGSDVGIPADHLVDAPAQPATPEARDPADRSADRSDGARDEHGQRSVEEDLVARGLTFEDAIRISGWSTLRDKTRPQWDQFFTLYDRMMALSGVPNGTPMAEAAAKLNQRTATPRVRK